MSKRAVLYARVSSKFQKEKGHRLKTQFEDMRAYADQQQMTVVREFEEAYTATLPFRERPYGSQIYLMAEQNLIDVLIVHTHDRLTRGDLENDFPIDLGMLLADMRDCGVEVHTADEGLIKGDISDFLKGWLAKKENQERAKKSKQGRQSKISKKLWPGNGPPPYGYGVEGHQKTAVLVINKDEAKVIGLIFEWYINGVGAQEIADRLTKMKVARRGSHTAKMTLTKWLPSHVYPILKRETYRGVFYANRYLMVKVPGRRKKKRVKQERSKWTALPVPAIIDNETWQKAQARLNVGRAMSKRSTKHKYLLGRLIACRCGYKVQGKPCHSRTGDVYLYYRCNGKYGNLTSEICDLPLFSVPAVDTAVWRWVHNLLHNPEKILKGYQVAQKEAQEANKPMLSELTQVGKMIEEKETELNRLLDLYLSSSFEIDILEQRKQELDQALFDLNRRKKELTIELQETTITDEQIASFVNFAKEVRGELAEDVEFETKREMLELLNFQAVLFVEGGEKKIKVSCYAGKDVVSYDSNSL